MTVDATRVRVKAGWPDAPAYEWDRAIADGLAMAAALGPLPDPPPATVELAIVEICAGELAAQRDREPGARDAIAIGGIRVSPPETDPRDPLGLVAQGLSRLRAWRGGALL